MLVPAVAVVHIPATYIGTVLKIRVTTIPYWASKSKENTTSILITYTHRIKCIISVWGFFPLLRLLLMPEGKHNLHLRFAKDFNREVENFLR